MPTSEAQTQRRVEAVRRAARMLRAEAWTKPDDAPTRDELLSEANELDLLALELAKLLPAA